MKNKLIGAVAALAIAVGGSLAAATPAQATKPAITKVYYNSPGSEIGSNTSLNAEYVRLTNKRSSTMNLKYWTLREKSNHVYKFSSDFRLKPGKLMRSTPTRAPTPAATFTGACPGRCGTTAVTPPTCATPPAPRSTPAPGAAAAATPTAETAAR